MKFIIFLDHFPIVHKGYFLIIEKIKKYMVKNNIDKCIIGIADDIQIQLPYNNRESMFLKVLSNDNRFDIRCCDNLKIFKMIKDLQETGNMVCDVFVSPENLDTVKSNLNGLKSNVRAFKHNYIVDDIVKDIYDQNYQEYCRKMPLELHDEFENLKEIYRMNKLNEFYVEEIQKIINK